MTKDFWETCDTDFAHITAGKYQTYDDAVAVWHKEFWDTCSWHDKIVVDYGCGGSWLYKELASMLADGIRIKKYYGLDIAQRQINAACAASGDNPDAEFLLLPQNLCTLNADILVCQSVIQHLNMEEYNVLLESINDSGIPELILNWRDGAGGPVFNERNVRLACHTDCNGLLAHLSRYEVAWLNPVRKYKMRYGGFRLK